MTDNIKLPPLPSPFGIVDPSEANECNIYDLKDLHDYAEAYATAAIEADRQTNKNLTHYMPEVIAALKATGCNESLVADIEKAMRGEYDRQARGEPVYLLAETDGVWSETSEAAFLWWRANSPRPSRVLYTAPQPGTKI